jgi:hypothetical protein
MIDDYAGYKALIGKGVTEALRRMPCDCYADPTLDRANLVTCNRESLSDFICYPVAAWLDPLNQRCQ